MERSAENEEEDPNLDIYKAPVKEDTSFDKPH
jgi:hypothetical protein